MSEEGSPSSSSSMADFIDDGPITEYSWSTDGSILAKKGAILKRIRTLSQSSSGESVKNDEKVSLAHSFYLFHIHRLTFFSIYI